VSATPALRPFIRGVAYDGAAKQLTVKFQTSSYIYHGVPPELGNAMAGTFESSEVEGLFNARVEGKFRSERVTA